MTKKTQTPKKVDWSREIIDWACTPNGQKELESAKESSSSAISELKKALLVDNEMLTATFDI
ncbi:hypothetical protein DSCW_48770 [Desulfosarcina widdelii]|uniref:Uncharacterized protein n=1 Tax=Desulfosarcina widdelii TaxID=947919 RepID=A0A5K7Z9K9_9BACT|nr:hypothetical protein [Desulfosarcina widdelii]BBO77460.1 hypothetical protein DSCW_48770 [Desulfosarcina widdelii]